MTFEGYKKVSRAILLNKDGKVLLGKRVKKGGAGKYALIGGLPEGEETPEQTIIREVKEELNLEFNPKFYKEDVDLLPGEEIPWQVTFFYGNYSGELLIDPSEVSDIIFVARADLDKYDIAFNHKAVLEEFFEATGDRLV